MRAASGISARILRLCVATAIILAVMPVLPAAAAAPPTTLYVDVVSGNDTTGTGTVDSPYKTITKAFAMSGGPGSAVFAFPGTYGPLETFPLYLPPGVLLESLDGPATTSIGPEGEVQALIINNALPNTGVSGFTIEGATTDLGGGGIRIFRDAPTLSEPGWPLVNDCIIQHNGAGYGGGICVEGASSTAVSQPLIVGCTIHHNGAGGLLPKDGHGGGIYSGVDADTEIVGCTVDTNLAADGGGGIYACLATIEYCDVYDNTAYTEGGGLELGDGCVVSDCVVSSNHASAKGGGVWLNWDNGVFMIERSQFTGNGSFQGSAIEVCPNAHTTVANCILDHNDANGATGGVIFAEDTVGIMEVVVDGCTIVDNAGAAWAGLYAAGDERFIVSNSIVRNALPPFGDESSAMDIYGSATVTYSNVRDTDTTGTGVIHAAPAFLDQANGDYELMKASPCVDTASPSMTLTDDYYVRPRPRDGNGDGIARCDMGALERPVSVVSRLFGDTRYETAASMANSRYWPGYTAVLASGGNFPDALAGSGLAGAYGGPLLLTTPTSCPPVIMTALENAGVTDVVIVGGTAVVSDLVVQQLESAGYSVDRIGGVNRYDTAARVATRIHEVMGTDFTGEAFLVRGDQFPDALAASPIAYSWGMPVLLTSTTSLPGYTQNAITGLGINTVTVVGGGSAVSAGVQAVVEGLPGVTTTRVQGGDRYATAAAIAQWAVGQDLAEWSQIGLATGINFPDALAGGALCGIRGGVLLLTAPTSLPAPTASALSTNKSKVVYAEVYGGPNAVSDGVKLAIKRALGW